MATGDLEIRMAHLGGADEQIDERLGALQGGVQAGLLDVLADGVTRTNDLRKELLASMDRQFFWLLGLFIVSIFLPIARSLGH
jgi:hypothetical protein